MHLNSGDLSKTIHAAMNAGSRVCIVYYGSTQHALQHELFTILEIHILILDVCVIHCNAIYFIGFFVHKPSVKFFKLSIIWFSLML